MHFFHCLYKFFVVFCAFKQIQDLFHRLVGFHAAQRLADLSYRLLFVDVQEEILSSRAGFLDVD